MRILLASVFVIGLQGCAIYGGISVHSEKHDSPEYYVPNPIGIVGIEKKYERFTGFCEHRSSMFYREGGLGLNECGVKYHFIE